MALFPRAVGGRHVALCRSDGETVGLATLDGQNWWHFVPLQHPTAAGELIQVGNCGSPLEADAGWLVLTHGVGPMRRTPSAPCSSTYTTRPATPGVGFASVALTTITDAMDQPHTR
jgi:hypothetical protein